MEFGPSLRELSIQSLFACHVLEVDFESWMKLLTLDMFHSLISLQMKLAS